MRRLIVAVIEPLLALFPRRADARSSRSRRRRLRVPVLTTLAIAAVGLLGGMSSAIGALSLGMDVLNLPANVARVFRDAVDSGRLDEGPQLDWWDDVAGYTSAIGWSVGVAATDGKTSHALVLSNARAHTGDDVWGGTKTATNAATYTAEGLAEANGGFDLVLSQWSDLAADSDPWARANRDPLADLEPSELEWLGELDEYNYAIGWTLGAAGANGQSANATVFTDTYATHSPADPGYVYAGTEASTAEGSARGSGDLQLQVTSQPPASWK